MKNKLLWVIWFALYALCVALGTVAEAEGALRIFLVLIGIGFFLPGAILLYRGIRQDDKKTVRIIRILAAASLLLTVLTFALTVLSVESSSAWGIVLQCMLSFVSAPMLCIQYWVVSLFLWACLLIGSFSGKKK